MRTTGPFDRRNPQSSAVAAATTADEWRIVLPAAALWAAAAAQQVPDGLAHWVLEFDPRMRLVSFEVWSGGVCVYGADDFLG